MGDADLTQFLTAQAAELKKKKHKKSAAEEVAEKYPNTLKVKD